MAELQPNKKTSEEPAAGALAATDLFRIVQGTGTDADPYVSRKATAVQMAAYFAGTADPTKVPIVTAAGVHTFTPTDAGAVVRHTSATANVATIALNADQTFSLTQVVTGRQVGAGQVTITPVGGVTLNVPHDTVAKTRAQGSVYMLHYVGLNEWDLTGDLAAA